MFTLDLSSELQNTPRKLTGELLMGKMMDGAGLL